MKEKGELSVATMKSLVEQEPSIVNAITNENGVITVEIGALEDLSGKYYDTAIAQYESQKQSLNNATIGAM